MREPSIGTGGLALERWAKKEPEHRSWRSGSGIGGAPAESLSAAGGVIWGYGCRLESHVGGVALLPSHRRRLHRTGAAVQRSGRLFDPQRRKPLEQAVHPRRKN